MQPYFLPYAGYFRLFAASDLFVIYDCVQFPRRGWVHRNRLSLQNGETAWLTMPLEKAPRDVLIRDLRFPDGAGERLLEQMRRFSAFKQTACAEARQLLDAACQTEGRPVDYIVGLLKRTTDLLDLPWKVEWSSKLNLPDGLRGQDRILAIAQAYGATRYVNLSGGRMLYDSEVFEAAGIELSFLPDYNGSNLSIAQAISNWGVNSVRNSIIG